MKWESPSKTYVSRHYQIHGPHLLAESATQLAETLTGSLLKVRSLDNLK